TRHVPQRHASAGLVEIWETERPEPKSDVNAWDPLAEEGTGRPADRLANRIATTIRTWLDRGELLASAGRPITAGDILILVRKRAPFAEPMIRALKQRGIAVAGADRIRVGEELAVMDLRALAEFMLLPEDDLSLATVLKSPIFGFDDGDLLRLRSAGAGSLWGALLREAAAEQRYADAAKELKDWRARADYQPPYEFFAGLLDRDGVRGRLLKRLGAEAIEGIEEFLSLALNYDEGKAPSLQGVLAALGGGGADVKRDMDQGRDEVRVMTVHGAKGLEAPIVFLADTCSAPSARRPALVDIGGEGGLFVWAVKGSGRHPAIEAGAAAEAREEAEEQDRLLYVAMTRARDRLYVAGFEGENGRANGCWYDTILDRLAPVTRQESLPGGEKVRRLEAKSQQVDKAKAAIDRPPANVPLPAWASRRAPAEAERIIPLRPSSLAPFELEDGSEVPEHAPPAEPARQGSPAVPGQAPGLVRGTLVHQLLQHLPGLPKASRQLAAMRFLALRAEISDEAARQLVSQTLAVLDHPAIAAVFGPGSYAEVPIAADLAPPGGKGVPVRVIGSIDRLLVEPKRILIVDFKTNRHPPHRAEDVPLAYRLQLAAYGEVLKQIYPGRVVKAALLWTETLHMMELAEAELARVVPDLFRRDGPLRA
ncbi:MAG: double-strand break repair helicase AddA, partial [Hyphomicrobiaceae bacterium]